ncbi:MAG: uroporphyrinogen decarboxylase family protein [Candidatus Humimicrobiaceae bacterium]
MLHICGDTLDRIEYIDQTGLSSFHFESKVDAYKAAEITAGRLALIGNVNNPSTLLFKKPEDILKEVQYAIKCNSCFL